MWCVVVSILSFSVSVKVEGKWKPVLGHSIVPSVTQVSHTPLSYYWGQSSNFNLCHRDKWSILSYQNSNWLIQCKPPSPHTIHICVCTTRADYTCTLSKSKSNYLKSMCMYLWMYSTAWYVVYIRALDKWKNLCNPPHKAHFPLNTRWLFTA